MKTRTSRQLAMVLMASVICALVPLQAGAAIVRGPAYAKHAMVASQHPIASKIGVEILKRGGNAVDAAIGVGLALAVVYPEAGNLGGGGFMLIRKPNGQTAAIDYREMAPAAASRDLFVDKDGKLIKGEGSSDVGYRASGVPGTLAGFELAFKKHGSGNVKWADLVEPARAVASNGYVLTHRLAELFKSYKETLSRYPESKRVFLKDGAFYEEGELFRQPDLARTLGRVKTNGAREFYRGETARMIAADMKANNGLITLDDLNNYVAKERTPLKGSYRGHEIITMPPPSSGGIVMLQVLNMLEGYDIRSMGANSAAKFHLLTEASRRAFADRAEFMADPDFADVPTSRLIDKNYAVGRRSNIDLTKAGTSATVGHGAVQISEGTETTHFTVIDKDGMVVSNTYTINDLYGSRVTIKGTGVLMNDEMDDFASRPGVPNMFGLLQGERNKVEGRKRPLSSMTPTIIMKGGKFWFAVGSPGGPTIINTVMQVITNVVDYEMTIQQAIDAPRVHHQWLPDQITYEPMGLVADTMNALRTMGHKFIDRPRYMGDAHGIMIEDKTGVRLGASDPRLNGKSIGY